MTMCLGELIDVYRPWGLGFKGTGVAKPQGVYLGLFVTLVLFGGKERNAGVYLVRDKYHK